MEIIAQQLNFSQSLPLVVGNVDYEELVETFQIIDEMLIRLKLDAPVVIDFLEIFEKKEKENAKKRGYHFSEFTYKQKIEIQDIARIAFRCAIARTLTGESYRKFTAHLAESGLLQNFCTINNIVKIKVPSKSKLQKYENYIGKKRIKNIVREVFINVSNDTGAIALGLEKKLSIEDLYMDSTCIKANIHFPVDWLLLRDAIKTLMLAVKIIRREGLKHRMDEPESFLKEINKLSMKMTFSRRKKKVKRERKRILREMLKLARRVEGHALRHRDLLLKNKEKTALCDGEIEQIIMRINNILEQLPKAIHQAYERIIGERLVKNNEKIFSLYDADINIMVRNKADAKIEFGNKLLLVEQADGLIVDWDFFKNKMPSDYVLLKPSIKRIKKNYPKKKLNSLTSDRGFDSASNKKFLGEIKNYICPKNVIELSSMMKDSDFAEKQKRRGSTEARIGILKNNFIGKPLRSKGFASRDQSVALCVLTHNLWVLARKIAKIKFQQSQTEKKIA